MSGRRKYQLKYCIKLNFWILGKTVSRGGKSIVWNCGHLDSLEPHWRNTGSLDVLWILTGGTQVV